MVEENTTSTRPAEMGSQVESPVESSAASDGHHSSEVWTVANVITVLRLFLVPLAFSALIGGDPDDHGRLDVTAFLLYAGAASTDWLDGQIARRTGTVTAIGKAIDPLVDRLLLVSGVVGLYVIGRIGWWIVALLVARDLWLLYGAWRLERHHLRMPVTYVGKVTTALLLAGFSLLILNLPPLSIAGSEFIPGTGLVYVGVALSLITAVDYTRRAYRMVSQA
ncbi:MAG: CDP-alcohol phosphatidyltransferase [Actinobacteria bacterium HGW-Actinobacteria-10]|nr:MAG: CDP-alcohol phosphatidyltransferase [Actinobacteria bacterium HGW-Actinobacteria-10]